jgi:hypothetical protein
MPPSKALQRRSADSLRIPEGVQLAIVFLPVLLTLLYIHAYAVDLPFQDQWAVVPSLMHMEAGHLHWGDIYRQHNEALIPVPMALMLLVAKVTHYDVVAEAYAGYACMLGSLAVLFAFFRRVQRRLPLPTLAFLPIAAIFLGWRSHEGLLWGFGLTIDVGLMLALLAIWGAIRATESPAFVWLAMAMAVLATFSYGSGLLTWAVGLAILMFPAKGRRSPRLMLLWTTGAVACIAAYFDGYMIHLVPWRTGLAFVLSQPVTAVHYALIYTGAALGANPKEDGLINFALILLFLPAAWNVARDAELRKAVLPFAAVLLFLLLTLGPLLSGRMGLGVDQPYYASRYASIAALWTAGIYVFLLAMAARSKPWRYALAAGMLLLAVGAFEGYREGLADARADLPKKTACREILRDYRMEDDADLSCFYPDVEIGRRMAFWLDEYRLSVFRERHAPATANK